MSDGARFVMTVLMACWALAVAYAVYHAVTTAPTGDGFTRGLNRVSGYLGWQAIAGMFAISVLAVGRGWPKGSAVRRLSLVPFALAMLHVAGLAGLFFWARFGV